MLSHLYVTFTDARKQRLFSPTKKKLCGKIASLFSSRFDLIDTNFISVVS